MAAAIVYYVRCISRKEEDPPAWSPVFKRLTKFSEVQVREKANLIENALGLTSGAVYMKYTENEFDNVSTFLENEDVRPHFDD